MIKTKRVVKYNPQHCMYYVVTELDVDKITMDMLKNITLHKEYGNYDVRYKRVRREVLCEGIYELYMTGTIDIDEYYPCDVDVIREVICLSSVKRRAVYELLERLEVELNNDELEELLEGCK